MDLISSDLWICRILLSNLFFIHLLFLFFAFRYATYGSIKSYVMLCFTSACLVFVVIRCAKFINLCMLVTYNRNCNLCEDKHSTIDKA